MVVEFFRFSERRSVSRWTGLLLVSQASQSLNILFCFKREAFLT